jgi:hypothetical protein
MTDEPKLPDHRNDDFIREHGPIGPECFGGEDYPDFCYDCGSPTPCNVVHDEDPLP